MGGWIIFIGYSVLILIYCIFQMRAVVRYKIMQIQCKANTLRDKLYFASLLVVGIIYLLREGLFAYSDEYLLGYNVKLLLSSVVLKKTSTNRFNRVKAIITIPDSKTGKLRDVVLRTSKKNFIGIERLLIRGCAVHES
jgi:hypothetical protein